MSIPQTPSPLSNILASKTYNAAWFSGATKEAQITAAIAAAVTDGALYVYVPASMLPYTASLVTFNSSIRMIREGGDSVYFDIKAYGAAGDGTTDDTAAFVAAIAAAAAVATSSSFGATIFLATGTYLVSSQLIVPAGVIILGAGSRASRIKSSFAGYAIKIGSTTASLAYGCGIDRLSILLTNTVAGAIQAIGTSDFYAENLYIEGVGNGGCTAIFLDGGTAANIFSQLTNIDCNHVKIGLRIGTSGTAACTSVTAVGFNSFNDLVAGSKGVQVDAVSGNGSRFFGGNMENCAIGFDIQGYGIKVFGMRFENNTLDVNFSGAPSTRNLFCGCSDLMTVTDTSGSTTNLFYHNTKNDGTAYPNSSTFIGSRNITLSQPADIVLANNASTTITAGYAFEILVYDSGVTGNVASILGGGIVNTLKIVSQTGVSYTLVIGGAGTVNFSLAGDVLTIENKLGSTTTLKLFLRKFFF